MSTKTTFKRIALVAVASLGFGVLTSVAPASAAGEELAAGASVTAITASTVTTTPVTSSAVFVKFGASLAALTAAAGNNADVITFKGALTSVPVGGSVSVSSAVAANAVPAGTATAVAVTAGTAPTLTAASTPQFTVVLAAEDTTAWSAQTLSYLGAFAFTPTVAGTYVMTIWNDADRDNSVDVTEVYQTASVTVAAATAAVPSATYSTISAWDATAYSKAAGTDAGTAETVTIKSTTDAALNGQTVRAVVTGPGTVKLTNAAAATVLGRDVSLALAANENTVSLLLEADGNSGKTTVDVYAGTTKVLTTAAVSFYGTLATLKVVQNKSVVTKNVALAGAVTISGLDAEGNAVPLADNTVVGTSSDTTVLVSKGDTNDTATDGVLTVTVTGANDVTTTSGRTATITWKYLISGTTYTPEVVNTFAIGAARNKLEIKLDKSEYAPGELVTATITSTDVSGNASGDADIIAAGGLTSSVALQGLTTAAVASVGGKATTTFYAPAAGADFTITAAYSDVLAVAQKATATATIVSPGVVAAQAASDAAAEATDAANAATDAANAAAEAADAATAAAQDAADAVAALSTQVSEMINALKKQITALTNLVIKIQKKVKA